MSTTETKATKAPAVTGTPSALQSEHGSTRIAETVVSKIAGLAAREVSGIYALGGGATRAFGALRERIPGGTTNASQGVSVGVGEAGRRRHQRRRRVRRLHRRPGEGRAPQRHLRPGADDRARVVEVNISVDDVHLPSEDDGKDEEPKKIESTSRVA